MQLFSLKNKTAIVTGACGLIGFHHCEELAEAGANVMLCDIGGANCKDKASGLGKNHLGLELDVTNIKSLEAARDKILTEFGHIDVLVNNAAINDMFENPALAGHQSMFENYPLDMFEKSMKVNV